MSSRTSRKIRKPSRLVLSLALWLMGKGATPLGVVVTGSVLSLVAGLLFFFTDAVAHPTHLWWVGASCCLLRFICLQVNEALGFDSRSQPTKAQEFAYFDLPDRMADAIIFLGLGFASESNAWLGLAAALIANFSAYIRTLGLARGASWSASGSGPMGRSHRILLVAAGAFLVASRPSLLARFETWIPEGLLVVVILGCVATICVRLYRIR